ncbi:hypothetical protein HYH03_016392 [Edaphochlamys debaryana]|uniref:Uncharacterized protein n=1 Tax=Edaphochlamys debaryana TaxID=47281 RepID=A0A836BQ70_9CHLO|nr:hypothetical protein HYH03_016392 [Edaphochlamys debaryana]|eukprot:KAG2484825.1 hypothetical protein HYH03_016392 [Edaphochlamys debaryana]
MPQPPRRSFAVNAGFNEEGFESGLIRGAGVKYSDAKALRLRRRALLQWHAGCPSHVLIIKKPKNAAASAKLREIGQWLTERGIQVYVERVVWATEFKEFAVFDPRTNADVIDFCITLGGDGTVLYMTSLFEQDEPLPPTLCFAMGSLGFLTPFDAAHFAPTLERVLDTSSQPLFCTLRTRKRCEVVYDGQLEAVHHVLNECVLDRGAFPGAALLEIFVDGAYITNVEADGLIISTPSGSTAYSMSAGGPMVAPSVPCTVMTPIAPLSLSFRPLVIPESSSICVHLPTCARSHARASFDGKKPMRVRRGTSIFFTTSLCPLPVISLGRMDTDWYEGITSKLKWNQAIRQLPSCPSPIGSQQQKLYTARTSSPGAAAETVTVGASSTANGNGYSGGYGYGSSSGSYGGDGGGESVSGCGLSSESAEAADEGCPLQESVERVSEAAKVVAAAAAEQRRRDGIGVASGAGGAGAGVLAGAAAAAGGGAGPAAESPPGSDPTSFTPGGGAYSTSAATLSHAVSISTGGDSCSLPDPEGSITDDMTNSLEDPEEYNSAAAVTAAAAAAAAAAAQAYAAVEAGIAVPLRAPNGQPLVRPRSRTGSTASWTASTASMGTYDIESMSTFDLTPLSMEGGPMRGRTEDPTGPATSAGSAAVAGQPVRTGGVPGGTGEGQGPASPVPSASQNGGASSNGGVQRAAAGVGNGGPGAAERAEEAGGPGAGVEADGARGGIPLGGGRGYQEEGRGGSESPGVG